MSDDDSVKLSTILHYWIIHNKEHSREFREWADKISKLGKIGTAKELERASQEMDKASKSLSNALRSLEEGSQ